MSLQLPHLQNRVVWIAAPLLFGLVIGVAVAVASSPSSLSAVNPQSGGVVQQTPTPLDVSPTPSVAGAGLLGDSARIRFGGSTLVASASNGVRVSSDGGKTWTALGP